MAIKNGFHGSSSSQFWFSTTPVEVLVFKETGKPEYQEKNLS